ncbi:MAG: Ig-like domain-containing protein [Acidobacteriaceae bacterium]
MPNASTTQTSSASDTTGTPIPLAYGYQWATGKRAEYYMTQNTNNEYTDYWRAGIWLLGHGEWDGCVELWINDVLIWQSENDNPAQFHFHRGSDATMGQPLTPSSQGPDQGVDTIWGVYPPAINPLNYNRIAYYTIFRKQLIENPTNDNQGDPTQWADIAPIGLWRATRVRLFDDQGNTTGYAFSTNPAWHFVDVLLRRKIMPEWNIDLNAGPTDLNDAVRGRFDWGTIYQSAQYFDEILANGRRRFTGNYAFTQQTTLQAVLEQILLCCRSFSSEYAGKIALNCDMPRSSVFTFSRQHILPGSWEASDATLHTTANRFLANFRDLLVPQASYIESITCADHAEPQVTTQEPHPFEQGDRIAIGGTDTVYDGEWIVDTVPPTINPGTINEVDPTTFTMISKGSNYPASVGAGGGIGLMYSRFKERVPEFWHKTNMMARGAIGLGIPRQRNKVKQSLDYATTTWDQASRLTMYERDRLLGLDQTPYVTPPNVKLRTSLFAKDAFGNLACAIRPGDHVSIDTTANFQYAGEYEVLEPLTVYPPSCQLTTGNSIARSPNENSGEIEFALGPYNEAVMYDTSDPTQAGWPSVPGSDPGNDSYYTSVALANGGTFAFFTGALASGQTWQLPSTGFPAGNVLAWAGPAGYQDYNHPMQDILLCDSGLPTRRLSLKYVDGEGNIWPGDTNYAALAWLSPDATTTSGGLTWIEFTLLGGETILFGQGVVADGTTIVLPSVPAPAAPVLSATAAGALAAATYFVKITYIGGGGIESLPSAESSLAVAIDDLLNVASPAASGGATAYNVYVGTATGAETKQNAAPIAIGTPWVEPTTGLIAGAALPAGYTTANSFMVGYPHDAPPGSNGNDAHWVGAYVDSTQIAHLNYKDGLGNVWHGNLSVLVFAWKNNMGTVTTQTLNGAAWMQIPLSNGMTFGVGCQLSMADGAAFSLPASAGDGTSLEAMVGTSGWNYPDNGHPAHGVKECYLDATNVVHIEFEDGRDGDVWPGTADVFALYCTPAAGSPTQVKIAPSTQSLPTGASQQFTATVVNNANAAVTWSVDGIAGGNVTVGMIDASGLYAAPGTSGSHTITATSVAVPTASGSAAITVTGSSTLPPSWASYSNSPAIALTQPTATEISLAAVVVTSGSVVMNYAARNFTIPAPSAPTWYYVTIADPTQSGEAGTPTLTATCQESDALVGVAGNVNMGAILALPAGAAVSMLAGGWPAPQTVQVGA